nr:hypothetical protein [Neobacillus sp. Marseille-Q6967]
MSFIERVKDKTKCRKKRTVLHAGDEGQSGVLSKKSVLHAGDEGQIGVLKEKNCPS